MIDKNLKVTNFNKIIEMEDTGCRIKDEGERLGDWGVG
jgi:hypothetical protein